MATNSNLGLQRSASSNSNSNGHGSGSSSDFRMLMFNDTSPRPHPRFPPVPTPFNQERPQPTVPDVSLIFNSSSTSSLGAASPLSSMSRNDRRAGINRTESSDGNSSEFPKNPQTPPLKALMESSVYVSPLPVVPEDTSFNSPASPASLDTNTAMLKLMKHLFDMVKSQSQSIKKLNAEVQELRLNEEKNFNELMVAIKSRSNETMIDSGVQTVELVESLTDAAGKFPAAIPSKSDTTVYGLTSNYSSFATKQYLQKYGLVQSGSGSPARAGNKKVFNTGQPHPQHYPHHRPMFAQDDRGRGNICESSSSDERILDITALKNQPKLI